LRAGILNPEYLGSTPWGWLLSRGNSCSGGWWVVWGQKSLFILVALYLLQKRRFIVPKGIELRTIHDKGFPPMDSTMSIV